ncbi:MBL fold metallo-hydrolase [Sphingomonas crocodyli]|uniref:Metallo-beta-lactamase domain-containing protein n=1 Tax=Sphingomonas crocodyli TaxID=1979270 RepID=A0A437M7X4_9SPHN|nr:MBL fold metallo-hydrolase [Sphingomonas crocodyli]RVT93821.1 hypothetical protein EOD43_08135 [Sphingomonas crocodyli]
MRATRSKWMRRAAIILGILIALGLAARFVLPSLLDRTYYSGPVSDHFDGQRFFNPEGQFGSGGSQKVMTPARIWRAITGAPGPGWPKSAPVRQTKPAARVAGDDLRVIWIGHATVLIQTQGLNILTDPVWADRVGPLGITGPVRTRAPGVRLGDLPPIDLILISHNHYDHMDLDTIEALWRRDRPLIFTSLGNDTLLKDRDIASVTRDWGGGVPVRSGVSVIVERVHHWGSRWGSDRNRALWSGFTLKLPGGNIFFAGDTGWGDGAWVRETAKHGPYRLAILPIGAYHPRDVFSGNHIDPQQSTTVFQQLAARQALGIHWGTFQLTEEAMDEPRAELARVVRARRIDPSRFRTLLPGQSWDVPK